MNSFFFPLRSKFIPTATAAALLFLSPLVGVAATIVVTGQIMVPTDSGASFKAGDTFSYSFTFDDTTVDTNGTTYGAQFGAGLTEFTLVRNESNTGTWDPADGTFSSTPNFSLGANGESITMQLQGSGFPQINGVDFFDVGLTFGWSGVRNFVDTGSGQTFAEMVGTSPLDFSTAGTFSAQIRDVNYEGQTLGLSVTAVPEPSTYAALAGLGALGLGLCHRRRRASAVG